jgi:RHS repeat-associated protein
MGRLIGTSTQYCVSCRASTSTNAYTYDAASNRTSLTSARRQRFSTYGYDTLNRLNGLANSWAGSFGFSYDALSRRTQLTRPNGINTNYSYDSVSHLLSVLHQAGTNTLDGASYTYDPAGNRTAKTNDLNAVTSNYSYDPLYELTQVTQGGSTTETYSYDPVGNRLLSSGVPTYSYNSSNELTSNSNGSYTYDANGDTLTEVNGNGYTWDFENRLTQAVVPGTNGGTTTFKYDPFGRRIQKSGPLGTTNYLYDQRSVVEEVDSSGNVLARYTQGRGVDEPLAQLRSGTTSYYQQDGLGSVTSLSNPAGALANTYTYDSYGRLTSSTGTLVNPLQYTGREFDSETGIYYYRARYFDPGAGRFLSEDRLRFGEGPNFYDYVQNNPLRWADPTGNGTTCWSVTPNGMTQVPCAGGCIATATGLDCAPPPGPPPLPPGDYWTYQETKILDRIDKCISEEIQEINQLEIEATNESLGDLPYIPGKSLLGQGAESVAAYYGAELLEHILEGLDYLDLVIDMGKEVWKDKEFNRKLNDAKQRECKCMRDGTNQ